MASLKNTYRDYHNASENGVGTLYSLKVLDITYREHGE